MANIFKVGDKVTITEEACIFFSHHNLSPTDVYTIETVKTTDDRYRFNVYFLKGLEVRFYSDELAPYSDPACSDTITLPRDVAFATYTHLKSFSTADFSKSILDLYKILEKEFDPDMENIEKARMFLETKGFSVEKKNILK